ncbi:MAG: hypothetical protein M1835_005940 [Candelina submexicana]|nr:MAG: hypothetical protein M1835_005940 [Candelina submexicana]
MEVANHNRSKGDLTVEKSASAHRLRAPRPNYNVLHALPLPLKTYPLPNFIPHNPFSVLHLLYVYVSQNVLRPCSHPAIRYKGLFSSKTGSIHVTEPSTVRALWEAGFFGKGSLSRSEPSWLEREKKRIGVLAGQTSEDATRRRREERKEFKNERARKEREAIEEKLKEEGRYEIVSNGEPHDQDTSTNGSVKGPIFLSSELDKAHPPLRGIPDSGTVQCQDTETDTSPSLKIKPPDDVKSVQFSPAAPAFKAQEATSGVFQSRFDLSLESDTGFTGDIVNQEHLQLTLEEAFFLVYGLGILEVVDEETRESISVPSLLSLSRTYSYFPPCPPSRLQPDDPFLLSYVVYHHFRSLGWVVRPGTKFAVDYLLYNRGPVFAHAEFAVVIVPAYSDQHWSATKARQLEVAKEVRKEWWWLHCVNRVQSQVQKSLILVFVDVPCPENPKQSSISRNKVDTTLDIGSVLKRYKIREISMKRWIPNRSRD